MELLVTLLVNQLLQSVLMSVSLLEKEFVSSLGVDLVSGLMLVLKSMAMMWAVLKVVQLVEKLVDG